jgi:hypothetical protein
MLPLVAVVAVAITGLTGGGAATTSAKTVSLVITYWDDEQSPASFQRWTLRCNPGSGTLPDRKRACAKLSKLSLGAFAQVPKNLLCTEIYGGPQKAVIKGTIGSARVWASFRRRNGCEIERWSRFSPWLLPPGGVTR